LRPYEDTHPQNAPQIAAVQKNMKQLNAVVRFQADADEKVSIRHVGPTSKEYAGRGEESPYKILLKAPNGTESTSQGVVVDSQKNTLSNTTLYTAIVSIDSWDAIGSAEVWYSGSRVATRVRPENSITLSGKYVANNSSPPSYEISWSSNYESTLLVSVRIEYLLAAPPDTWKQVYYATQVSSGTSKTGLLPQAHFPHNSAARVRVSLSDGFNRTSALSDVFVCPGISAHVHIMSPQQNETVRAGSTVYLHADVYDDLGERILDKVTWTVGGKVVATGALTSWETSKGSQKEESITVEAEDYLGRKSVEEVVVLIM
jgi:hypothetical protein